MENVLKMNYWQSSYKTLKVVESKMLRYEKKFDNKTFAKKKVDNIFLKKLKKKLTTEKSKRKKTKKIKY